MQRMILGQTVVNFHFNWRRGPSTPTPRAQWLGSVSPSADFSLSSFSDLPYTLGAHGMFHLGKRR